MNKQTMNKQTMHSIVALLISTIIAMTIGATIAEEKEQQISKEAQSQSSANNPIETQLLKGRHFVNHRIPYTVIRNLFATAPIQGNNQSHKADIDNSFIDYSQQAEHLPESGINPSLPTANNSPSQKTTQKTASPPTTHANATLIEEKGGFKIYLSNTPEQTSNTTASTQQQSSAQSSSPQDSNQTTQSPDQSQGQLVVLNEVSKQYGIVLNNIIVKLKNSSTLEQLLFDHKITNYSYVKGARLLIIKASSNSTELFALYDKLSQDNRLIRVNLEILENIQKPM